MQNTLNNIPAKVALLESMGFEVHDYDIFDTPGANVNFSGIEGDFQIEFDQFTESDSRNHILAYATRFSCCGDELNSEIPLCPSCKEWC